MKDRILDSWIDNYLIYTDNSEPPRMFRLWSAISVIAAVLQRKCKLPWGTLTFYPNLYTVLVGPPADDSLRRVSGLAAHLGLEVPEL